jgi:hypothetical protein
VSTHKDWSHLTADQLHALYDQLGNWRAVQEHLQIDKSVLIAIRRRLGMTLGYTTSPDLRKSKPNRLDPHEDQIVSLALQGLNCYEIAEAIGEPSAEHVREFLVRRNIARRKAGPPRGKRNPSWNGGQTIDKHGYILVRAPEGHPGANSNGYIRLHRLVMEQKLGRYLVPTEVVHHLDGNKRNNDPGNLEVFESNGEHLKVEWSDPEWAEHQSRIRRKDRAGQRTQPE